MSRLLIIGIVALGVLGYSIWKRPAAVHTMTAPGSGLVISLIGPDEKKMYRYTVTESGHLVASRFLGLATVEDPGHPEMTDDNGRLTIAWGKGPAAASAVIDTKERKIIRDSNEAGIPNEAFWKPVGH